MLGDGSYDVIVVDADAGSEPGSVAIDVAVAAGDHRGELVSITASGLDRDPIDLLAVPATLVITDGTPVLNLEG